MKKWKAKILTVAMVVMLVATAAWALDWHTANQATVAWDAITYQLDPGERVTYVVYLANAVTDPQKTNPVEVGRTQATDLTITIGTKGSYFAGVRSVVEVDDGTGTWSEVAQSTEVAWSDDPQYVQGGATFGLRFYPAPSAIQNLRPVSG